MENKRKNASVLLKNNNAYRRFLVFWQQLLAFFRELAACTGVPGESRGCYRTFVAKLRC